MAWLAADVLKVRGRVVEDNLLHAFPELTPEARRDLTRRMWEHLFLLAVEMAQAPRKIHWTNWRDYIDLARREVLVRVLFDDRPVVLVSAHYGNFELSGYVLGVLGFPSFTIARPLDNPLLDRFINEFRGSQGQFIFPKTGSAKQVDALIGLGGHAGPAGRPARRRQRLLGRFFRPARFDPQGHRPVRAGERRSFGALLLAAHWQTA